MRRKSFQAFMIVLFLYTSGNLFSQYYQPVKYPESQFSEKNMPIRVFIANLISTMPVRYAPGIYSGIFLQLL